MPTRRRARRTGAVRRPWLARRPPQIGRRNGRRTAWELRSGGSCHRELAHQVVAQSRRAAMRHVACAELVADADRVLEVGAAKQRSGGPAAKDIATARGIELLLKCARV